MFPLDLHLDLKKSLMQHVDDTCKKYSDQPQNR